MTIKVGDRIKYQSHFIHYTHLGDKNPTQGIETKEVIIVASAKGTDYEDSDWIVCKPQDYPITDLRSYSFPKHWGISNDQIIEVYRRR